MAISEHKITATVLPVAGGTVIPAHDVERPGGLIASETRWIGAIVGNVFTVGGFAHTAYSASGDGNTQGWSVQGQVSPGSDDAESVLIREPLSNGTVADHDLTRTFSGLVPGRRYSAGVWTQTTSPDSYSGIAASGKAAGGAVANGPSNWTYIAATFTATTSSQAIDLYTEFRAAGETRFDQFTLTALPYTETVPAMTLPADPIPLSVISGSVTVDESWSPFVQVSLTCWTPSNINVLEQIDPRLDGIRVQLHTEVDYVGTRPGTSKDYDLVLRSRSIDPDNGTMTLTLASAEARLQDRVLVATQPERVYGLSVKTAVDYALAKIGATLAPGFTDANVLADVTPAPFTNLFLNPSFETNGTGVVGQACTAARTSSWAQSGSFSISLTAPTSTDSYMNYQGDTGALRNGMEAGKTYTVTGYSRVPAVITGAVGNRPRCITVFTRVGMGTYSEVSSTPAPNAVGTTRHVVTFTVPAGATEAFIRFNLGHSGSATILWDAITLTEGDRVPDYFDGSTSVALRYTDTWSGTAHASTSTRTFLPNSDAMIWKPGVSAWAWLESILNATARRLYADELGVWRLVPKQTLTPGQINVSPTNGLTRSADVINRDSDLYYDSVVVRYSWEDSDGERREVFDIAGAPGTKTKTIEIDAPLPRYGAAQAWLNAALGRGRSYDIEAISDYSARPGMQIVLTVPNQIAVVGIIVSVRFNFPSGTMSVETRGIVETPETSWLFAPNGRRWQDITTGTPWTGYTP